MNEQVKKIVEYNKVFVDQELYLKYTTSKYPDRKIAILSCMDTRMTELLPAAMGLKNGDVKMIKNAGGRVLHEYGSIIFSLIVAIYELGVDTILVVGHDDCGARLLDGEAMIEKMLEKGISQETLTFVNDNHKNLHEWLKGFEDLDSSVESTVQMIQEHPLIHKDVEIFGFVMNPVTGELRRSKA